MSVRGGARRKLTIRHAAGRQFTQVYLTPNNHCGVVLYGVVAGFVLYVAFELAAGHPAVGAWGPASAALGPAFVGVFVGRRVLFRQPDGRA